MCDITITAKIKLVDSSMTHLHYNKLLQYLTLQKNRLAIRHICYAYNKLLLPVNAAKLILILIQSSKILLSKIFNT